MSKTAIHAIAADLTDDFTLTLQDLEHHRQGAVARGGLRDPPSNFLAFEQNTTDTRTTR